MGKGGCEERNIVKKKRHAPLNFANLSIHHPSLAVAVVIAVDVGGAGHIAAAGTGAGAVAIAGAVVVVVRVFLCRGPELAWS